MKLTILLSLAASSSVLAQSTTLTPSPSPSPSPSSSPSPSTTPTQSPTYSPTYSPPATPLYPNGNGTIFETITTTAYTTYCPSPTEIVQGGKTYTVTKATTLTITDCPCTLVRPVQYPTAITRVITSCPPTATTEAGGAIVTNTNGGGESGGAGGGAATTAPAGTPVGPITPFFTGGVGRVVVDGLVFGVGFLGVVGILFL